MLGQMQSEGLEIVVPNIAAGIRPTDLQPGTFETHPSDASVVVAHVGPNKNAFMQKPGSVVVVPQVSNGDTVFYAGIVTYRPAVSGAESALGFTCLPVTIDPLGPEPLSRGMAMRIKDLTAQQDGLTGTEALDRVGQDSKTDITGHGGAALLVVKGTQQSQHGAHAIAKGPGFGVNIAAAGLYHYGPGRGELARPIYVTAADVPLIVINPTLQHVVDTSTPLDAPTLSMASGLDAVSSATGQPTNRIAELVVAQLAQR